eukprot:3927472-Alexandrium_andersonii.AAC.1
MAERSVAPPRSRGPKVRRVVTKSCKQGPNARVRQLGLIVGDSRRPWERALEESPEEALGEAGKRSGREPCGSLWGALGKR